MYMALEAGRQFALVRSDLAILFNIESKRTTLLRSHTVSTPTSGTAAIGTDTNKRPFA
jgi:hypothetical protein